MEEKQEEKKVRVLVTARPRHGDTHTHYHIPGHQLTLGGPSVEVEVTEQELEWLKADKFVTVDEPGKPSKKAEPIIPEPPAEPPKDMDSWTKKKGHK